MTPVTCISYKCFIADTALFDKCHVVISVVRQRPPLAIKYSVNAIITDSLFVIKCVEFVKGIYCT